MDKKKRVTNKSMKIEKNLHKSKDKTSLEKLKKRFQTVTYRIG